MSAAEDQRYFVNLDDGTGADRHVRLETVMVNQEIGAYRRSWIVVSVDDNTRTARAVPADQHVRS